MITEDDSFRDGPLDDPPDGDESTTTASTPTPKRLHAHIGRYRVDGVLGRSSGVVYRATQENPHRPIALKVLRPDNRSPEALARLMQEAEILARLSHPHIAQVYESGTHDDGHGDAPYVAMEYVPNAKSLTKYANERSLNTAARLKLFVQVCEAVSHGHFKGVLHCDLKPSNILVNADGQVKVIDFGISQWMGASPDATGAASDYGHLLGTIPYMSPEQTEPDRSELDLRTDVYSLGVVLFELISGEMPFDTTDKPRNEILRMIREDTPTRLRDIKPAAHRDMEAIVERALEKDRGERYQSAKELRHDIERFLADDPIEAREPTMMYVLGRIGSAVARRHPIVLTICAGLVTLLAAEFVWAPLIYEWTNFNRAFTAHLSRVVPLQPTGNEFGDIRLIHISDKTIESLGRLAPEFGLSHLDLQSDPKALRSWHGLLMTTLAAARPDVVAWDIAFPDSDPNLPPYPEEYDSDMVAGILVLNEIGTQVVVSTLEWRLDSTGRPIDASGLEMISPTILQHVSWGCSAAGFTPEAPWYLDVAVFRENHDTMASMPLACLAARYSRGSNTRITNSPDNPRQLRVQYFDTDPENPKLKSWGSAPSLVECSSIAIVGKGDSDVNLLDDDISAIFQFDVPGDALLRSKTLDYEWVLTAEASSLQDAFRDKIVLIGDLRADDHFGTPDGRVVHGSYGHAAGLDSMLRNAVIRATSGAPVVYLSLVFGAVIGWRFRSSGRIRWLILGLSALMLILGSAWYFVQTRVVFNPEVAILVVVSCSESTTLITTIGRTQRS